LLELALVEGGVDAEVVEEVDHDGPGDGNAVFEVRGEVGVTADGGHAVDGQGNLEALVQLRIGGVARNAGAVRVGELHIDAVGDVTVGCCATYIEAAQVALTTGVETVVGRGDVTAEALHVAKLGTDAEDIATVGVGREVADGQVTLIGDKRGDVTNVAANAGDLENGRVLFAVAGAQWVVDGVVDVAEGCGAVDDAGEGIAALDSRAETDRLEEGLRSRGEGGDVGLVELIGHADALKGMALERIADGEVQALRGLVVVLSERLLRRG
jgi:hypothetical protein